MSIIKNKLSAGITSNTNFRLKTQTFDQLNPLKEVSPVLPQSTFFGKTPDPNTDPFARRKVAHINDVDLVKNNEPEEIKNLKRMPVQVMDEETLPRILSAET